MAEHSLIVLALVVFASVVFAFFKRKNSGPLPPGPPKHWIPLIGNLHQVLASKVPLSSLLQEWNRQYAVDGIYSFSILGHNTIVACTTKTTKDLFETRGANYSSRPELPLLHEFTCKESNIGFQPYGDMWRRHRRAIHRELNVNAFGQYDFIQEREAWILSQGILEYPQYDKLPMLLERWAGSTGIGAVYDLRVKSYDSPELHEFSSTLQAKLALVMPFASMYDITPFASYIPEFFMPSKRTARLVRERSEHLDTRLRQTVEERLANDQPVNGFMAEMLRREKDQGAEMPIYERDALCGTIVAAAVDTSSAGLMSCILALVLYPEVQQKLQDEVDQVVGRDRLPGLGDLSSLPYARAFAREALRWRSPNRYSVPHSNTEADHYGGYYIPKRSTVIGLNWALEHDEDFFPDHDNVVPERWMNEDGDVTNLPQWSFGFGRRVCPGQNMALSSLALGSACVAWAVTLTKLKDKDGNIVEPDPSPNNVIETGTITRPKVFPYKATPRFANAEKVAREIVRSVY